MRCHPRKPARSGAIAALLFAASLAIANPAAAQTASQAPPPGTGPYGMSMTDWQSLSCLGAGIMGSGTLYYWSDVLTAPVTGVIHPLLLIPSLAAGFLGACSFASSLAPAVVWIYRHL